MIIEVLYGLDQMGWVQMKESRPFITAIRMLVLCSKHVLGDINPIHRNQSPGTTEGKHVRSVEGTHGYSWEIWQYIIVY